MDNICGSMKKPGPLGKSLINAFDEFGDYLNVVSQKIYFKREALADRALWTGGKKRYAVNVWNSEGVAYAKPKIKVKGFEMVKTSHPKICRKKMKEALEIIMTRTEPDLWEFVRDFRKQFFALPIEEIAFPRSCNDLRKYAQISETVPYIKGTPQNIKAAMWYNHMLKKKGLTDKYPKIEEGQKIKFVKLKEPNPLFDDVIGFPYVFPPELGLHNYVDYDSMFEGTFLEPLNIILHAIGWNAEKQINLKGLLF
jgi:DNA polymerase elongation subunit (family B)